MRQLAMNWILLIQLGAHILCVAQLVGRHPGGKYFNRAEQKLQASAARVRKGIEIARNTVSSMQKLRASRKPDDHPYVQSAFRQRPYTAQVMGTGACIGTCKSSALQVKQVPPKDRLTVLPPALTRRNVALPTNLTVEALQKTAQCINLRGDGLKALHGNTFVTQQDACKLVIEHPKSVRGEVRDKWRYS
jgi:hypothetical protein